MGFMSSQAGELGLSTPSSVIPSGGGEALGVVSTLFDVSAQRQEATNKAAADVKKKEDTSLLLDIVNTSNQEISKFLADSSVSADINDIESINRAYQQNPRIRSGLDARRSIATKRLFDLAISRGIDIELLSKATGLFKSSQEYTISGAEKDMSAADEAAKKLRDTKISQMVALNIDPNRPDAEVLLQKGLDAARTLQDIKVSLETDEKIAISQYRANSGKIEPLLINGFESLAKQLVKMPAGQQKDQFLKGLKDNSSGFTSFMRFNPSVSEQEKKGYINLYNKLPLEEKARLDKMVADSGAIAYDLASGKLALDQANTKFETNKVMAANELYAKIPEALAREVSFLTKTGTPLDFSTQVLVFNAVREATSGAGGKADATQEEIDASKTYSEQFSRWMKVSNLEPEYLKTVKNTITYFNDMALKNKDKLSADGWEKTVDVVSDKKALEWVNAARMSGVESVDTQRYEDMYRENFKSIMSSVEGRVSVQAFDSRGEIRPKSVPYKELITATVTNDGIVKFVPKSQAPEAKKAAAEANAKASPVLTKTVKAYAHLMWGNTDYSDAYNMLMDISDQEIEQAPVKEDKTSSLNLSDDRLKFLQGLSDEDWQQLMQA